MAENKADLEPLELSLVGRHFGDAAEYYKFAFSQLNPKLKGPVLAGLNAIANQSDVSPNDRLSAAHLLFGMALGASNRSPRGVGLIRKDYQRSGKVNNGDAQGEAELHNLDYGYTTAQEHRAFTASPLWVFTTSLQFAGVSGFRRGQKLDPGELKERPVQGQDSWLWGHYLTEASQGVDRALQSARLAAQYFVVAFYRPYVERAIKLVNEMHPAFQTSNDLRERVATSLAGALYAQDDPQGVPFDHVVTAALLDVFGRFRPYDKFQYDLGIGAQVVRNNPGMTDREVAMAVLKEWGESVGETPTIQCAKLRINKPDEACPQVLQRP